MTTPIVPKALIRFVRKRLTAWSPERDDREVQKVEFTTRDGEPDLRPSVFEIELGDLIRAYCEFATSRHSLETTLGIDVAGVPWHFHQSPGSTNFRFTTEAHRVAVIHDQADLLDFVREVRKDFERRKHRVEKVHVLQYARDRIARMDPEWLAALNRARTSKAESWVTKLPPSIRQAGT